MTPALPLFRRLAVLAALGTGLTGLLMPAAQARVFVGVGVPFYVPGPYYYPPPVYYPPPPVYYAPPPPVTYAPPPQYSQAPAVAQGGQMCYAGPYTCPMDRPVATGAGCYCLGNGGQRVSGRAN